MDILSIHPALGARQWRDVQPSYGNHWGKLRNISYVGQDDLSGQLGLPLWTRQEETRFRESLFYQAVQTLNENARELQCPVMDEVVIGTLTPVTGVQGEPIRSSSEEPPAVPAGQNITATTTTSMQGSESHSSNDEKNVSETFTEDRVSKTESVNEDEADWADELRSVMEHQSDDSEVLSEDL
jgi:hypothetical protein